MINNKKSYLLILIFMLFVFVLMILPYFNDLNMEKISAIMFLKFNDFDQLNLDEFSVKYLVTFILFFQITFYQKISLVSENASYLSMYLHKIGKKKYLKKLLMNNIKDIGLLHVFSFITISLLSICISLQNNMVIEISVYIHVYIYLLKYFLFIYVLLSLNQVIFMIKDSSYCIIQSYFLFIILMVSDMFLDISVITLSNSMISELFWLVVVMCIGIGVLTLIGYYFIKMREIYYD